MVDAMKVGTFGSGHVVKALGDGFLKPGQDVILGTRATAKLANWAPFEVGVDFGVSRSTKR